MDPLTDIPWCVGALVMAWAAWLKTCSGAQPKGAWLVIVLAVAQVVAVVAGFEKVAYVASIATVAIGGLLIAGEQRWKNKSRTARKREQMIVTLKMHCEALLLLVAMTWAVAVGCVVYPSSAGALLAAGIAGLGMIFIVRRSIFDCVGFRLVDDERKLTTLRRRLARGYLLFGAPVIAVALAVVNGAT